MRLCSDRWRITQFSSDSLVLNDLVIPHTLTHRHITMCSMLTGEGYVSRAEYEHKVIMNSWENTAFDQL